MADDGFRLEIKGLNKLTRALRQAGASMEDMREANTRVGQVVVRRATPITPRDTGALAGSIRPSRRVSGASVSAGGGRIRYARFVEFGTRKMAARPYLYKGARDSEDEWLDVYQRELERLLDEVGAQADGTD